MLRTLFSFLRGSLVLLLLIVNMLTAAIFIFILACIAWLMPLKLLRHQMMKAPLWVTDLWMYLNKYILLLSTHGKWDIQGTDKLSRKNWYILICNHSSWMDIPVLGAIFTWKIPLIKFFMKKDLLWQLPIAGLDCYLLGYPLMARHTREQIRKRPELKGKDIETTKKACEKFKEHPTTFMNFVEGTRLTPQKQDRQNSPYTHLLKPKSGGVAIVMNEMRQKLDGIINTTIYYDADDKGMWRFLCGRIRKIYIRYEVLPITDDLIGNYYEDRTFRSHFQQWLNRLWEEKDQQISHFKTNT